MDLIYDRKQSDVVNKTSKGYHNYADLNRVEGACKELAELLTSYGYPVQITVKTDWGMKDKRKECGMERIRKNIGVIKDTYYSMKTTPTLPTTINPITWQKANDIEKILHDIDLLIRGMKQVFIYSGVGNCGQNRVWQQRFRRVEKPQVLVVTWDSLEQTTWNEFEETLAWNAI